MNQQTSYLRITAIEALVHNYSRLQLEDGSKCDMPPDWMARHKPEVGGYLVESKTEQWYAKDSSTKLMTLRDTMVECIRIEIAKLELAPGDMLGITFKDRIPAREEVAYLSRQVERFAPGVRVGFFGPDVELSVIKAPAQAEAVPA